MAPGKPKFDLTDPDPPSQLPLALPNNIQGGIKIRDDIPNSFDSNGNLVFRVIYDQNERTALLTAGNILE